MAVIPAPKLPERKLHKHPLWMRHSTAFGMALIAAGAILFTIMVLLPASPLIQPLIKGFIIFSFVSVYALVYWLDSSEPTVTIEEMQFRNRLNAALSRDARIEQLNSDYALLSAAADDLYHEMGKEKFAELKNADVVNRAVELARIGSKQKEIDEKWKVTEH